jgi:phosphoglycolate phosphatase
MGTKLVLFDFDGTLADSFAWFARVVNDTADRFRFKRIEPEESDMLRGKSAREVVRHLGVPAWKLPIIAHHMRQRQAAEIAQTKLFDGTAGMLRTLHASGIAIAVVTSNTESNVRAVLGPDLARLVSYFRCGAALFGKATKLTSVLRESGVTASDAICIGDELRDMDAARVAGIAFGAVAWGYTRPDALLQSSPDEMFHSMDEICAKLRDTAAPSSGAAAG